MPYMPYTDEQVERMSDAFDLVADKGNWKNEIDALVPADADRKLITDAVIFYTGSMPSFIEEDGQLRVVAAGYYACIGS